MSKDLGTPETASRLVPHPVWTLLKRRYLLQEHADAAWQIEEAFRALTSPATWRCMRFEGEGYELRSPSFVAHLSDRQARQIRDFNDWSAEMARRGWGKVYRAVVDCMTEALTLREIERGRGWRNGSAKRKLRDGLQVYCEVVGTL